MSRSLDGRRGIALAALLCLQLIFGFIVSANPFFSGGGKDAPAPVQAGSAGALTGIQFSFRNQAASILNQLRESPSLTLMAALALSCFIYGILHAAGPGHRKAVVFSLFLARKAKWHEPLAAGFASAGVHSGSSVIIILALSAGKATVVALSHTDLPALWMDGMTVSLVALLALFLVIRKVIAIASGTIHAASGDTPKGLWSVVVVSSLAPCPGATMILLAAVYLDVTFAGVVAVTAMSAGMGIVISAAGYLAYSGREGLFGRLKAKERSISTIAAMLEVASYSLLLAVSLWAAWPFMASVIGMHA